jgi:hypothetical protein
MIPVCAEACSKLYHLNSCYIGDVNGILIIVVLWRILKETKEHDCCCWSLNRNNYFSSLDLEKKTGLSFHLIMKTKNKL